jgi:hypothetical protein
VAEELIESGLCMESLILPKAGSDHWPIALQIIAETTPALKPFWFEKFWLTHPDFQHLATIWWQQAEVDHRTKMYKFQKWLKNFKQMLKHWNITSFGNIFQNIKDIESRLVAIQEIFIRGNRTPELMTEEGQLLSQLEQRKQQEEILWKQKSIVQRLKEGEKNTKFFHRTMIHRRHINRITHLEDAHGNLL